MPITSRYGLRQVFFITCLLSCLTSCTKDTMGDDVSLPEMSNMSDVSEMSDLSQMDMDMLLPDQQRDLPTPIQQLWTQQSETTISTDAMTPALMVELQAPNRIVAVRIKTPAEQCVRLEDVRWLPSNEQLVAPAGQQEGEALQDVCTDCSVPTLISAGGVMGVFGPAPDGASALSFRVVHRDCELYRRPNRSSLGRVTWWSAQYPSRADVVGQVSLVYQSMGTSDDEWQKTFLEHLRAPYRSALQIKVMSATDLPARDGSITIGAGSYQSLFTWLDLYATNLISIYAVPCLDTRHVLAGTQSILGKSTHIPGGGGDLNLKALGGLFVSMETCDGERIDAAIAGRIAAHELGHALGLYHSDTTQGRLDVEAPANNIMRSDIINAPLDQPLGLSPRQKNKILTHPDVFTF